MVLILGKIFICLLILLSLLSGFTYAKTEENPHPSVTEQEPINEELSNIKQAFEFINERNETLKKSALWLREAHSGLKIKRLNDIPKEEYGSYRKYLYKNQIYIIVHPGFYSFFVHKSSAMPKDKIDEFPAENLAYRILSEIPDDNIGLKLVRESEKLLRNFLEYMSFQKRLVILILPRDYKNHLANGYSQGLDEYARYLNDMANNSDSIIYMESEDDNNGSLTKTDTEILSSFLKEIQPKRVLYSGGFVGRCLDRFNTVLVDEFGYDKVYFMPELASISPLLVGNSHSYLITKFGKINFKGVEKYAVSMGFERVLKPKIKHSYLIRTLEKMEKVNKEGQKPNLIK